MNFEFPEDLDEPVDYSLNGTSMPLDLSVNKTDHNSNNNININNNIRQFCRDDHFLNDLNSLNIILRLNIFLTSDVLIITCIF